MMTIVRSLMLGVAVSTVLAFGACKQQPHSVIESIEKTMHHHDHGDSHGEGAKDSKGAAEGHGKKEEAAEKAAE